MAQSKEAASSLATHILQVGKTKNEAHALVAARWVHNTFAGEQALKGHLDECGSNLPLYRAQTARWASQIRNLKWILYQSRPLTAYGAVLKVSLSLVRRLILLGKDHTAVWSNVCHSNHVL